MIESISIGVAASLAASLLFLWILYNFKPKVEISPYIADQTVGGHHRYAFKILNKTRSTIFDIRNKIGHPQQKKFSENSKDLR